MAGSLSTALHHKLLDHILKTTQYTVPTNIYVALYSVAPTKAGGGTELTGNGYARKVHDAWNAGAAEAATNNGAITFAAASGGDWAEAVAFGLFDAIAAGNYLGFGDLTVARTVLDGDDASFADTALSVEIAEV
jgi:hypothetical protein